MTEEMNWAERIRAAGLRATSPRLLVVETLAEHTHISVEELVEHVKRQGKTLSLQSAYNVLTDLCKVHLVRSIELPHQPARYELDCGDNHHHAVCNDCGKIYDVACAVGYTPCLTPVEDHGMVIRVADVLYRGVCIDCQGDVVEKIG